MRLGRDAEEIWIGHYLECLDVHEATRRTGIAGASARHYGLQLSKRARVQQRLAEEMEARKLRLRIDADFVLSELVRQLWRLHAMLGQDAGVLYGRDGSLRPVAQWPEIWRTHLVSKIESRDIYDKDGNTAGTVQKIERESALAIERQIRETLSSIGEHTTVGAFERESRAQDITINVVYQSSQPKPAIADSDIRLITVNSE